MRRTLPTSSIIAPHQKAKQTRKGREQKAGQILSPRDRLRALFSMLWRARLLENSQVRAGGAFERGSN